jgi:hypothetical protein
VTGENSGPVTHFFASFLGIDASPSSAQAVAVCAAPGSAYPGALFPIALVKDVIAGLGFGEEFKIGSGYHYPNSQAGQWTSFDLDANDVTTVKNLIDGGNTTTINTLESIWIQPGTKTAIYKYVPVGAHVLLPVVDGIIRDNTHARMKVDSFICFEITASVGGNQKYVAGRLWETCPAGLTGPLGPSNGAASPPVLVD